MSDHSGLPPTDVVDQQKRRLLRVAGGLTAGLVVAGACPLLGSLSPSLSAQQAGAPVRVDLTTVSRTEVVTVAWQGQPVWLLYRTESMLAAVHRAVPFLADPWSEQAGSVTPSYCRNPYRSRNPAWLVVIGICTHLGCIPMLAYDNAIAQRIGPDFPGGFLCPCHGSQYDLAGRVFKNMPAPDNLHIPPHYYPDPHTLVIGADQKA